MNQTPTRLPHHRIDAIGLECVYGFNQLFTDLSFTVSSGTALRIMGSNGAGKTSLLRILCGLSLAESGEIHLNGVPIHKSINEYRALLCYLGHKTGLKDDLTPIENLNYLSAMAPAPYESHHNILEQLGIGNRHNKPCRQLSAGQKQRISIARVIASKASVWFLDEPATALDTDGVDLLTQAMQNHLNRNGLIIFSSHQSIALDEEGLQEVTWSKPVETLRD